jgi:hypothetical protein
MRDVKVSPDSKSGAQGDSVQPWWRYRMLWLVIGGPLIVVVASIGTAVVAIRGADPVMTKEEMAASVQGGALMPAEQARNHAAAPKP